MKIYIGTDCSGIEAPIQALDKICKVRQLTYHHSFSSEIDPFSSSYSLSNFSYQFGLEIKNDTFCQWVDEFLTQYESN